jgi:hypothetical protein
VTVDRSADGIASVCLDEEAIAALAWTPRRDAVRAVATFRYDESPFAVARERAFAEQARAVGIEVAPGWGGQDFSASERGERPAAMVAWLRALPKPCGISPAPTGGAHGGALRARGGLPRAEDLARWGPQRRARVRVISRRSPA